MKRELLETAVPDRLKPAAGQVPLRTVYATGTQTYECRVSRKDPQQMEWALVAPDADLRDENGERLGNHAEGPSWRHIDGSEVTGRLKASAEAPLDDALPWQLLKTYSVGGEGAFAKVTSIQCINTIGGTPPGTKYCTARLIGTRAIVPYNADYVMYGEG